MKASGIDDVPVEVGDLDQVVRFLRGRIGLLVHRRFGTVLFRFGDETPGLGAPAGTTPQTGDRELWPDAADARSAAAGPQPSSICWRNR
jgi:hypothetical protein